MFLLLSFVLPSMALWCNNPALPDEERSAILDAHNAARSKIALGQYIAKGLQEPPAADMLEMMWDCDIEASAQKYANTCPSEHSHWPGLGENLYWQWSSNPIPISGKGKAAADDWISEFQTFGFPSNIFRGTDMSIGHATQMSWSATNKVGCAIRQCPSQQPGFPYMVAVVCQYTPSGNYLNTNVYKIGPTCSACPAGTTCSLSTGLCAANSITTPGMSTGVTEEGTYTGGTYTGGTYTGGTVTVIVEMTTASGGNQ